MDDLSKHVGFIPLDDRQHFPRQWHNPPAHSLNRKDHLEPLGVPTVKKRLQTSHGLAAIISLICLALAITAVANEKMSWLLGQQNYQLIVVGFLLSVINLSLASIAPNFFLLLEARYGLSTLQNYDSILRNEIFGSKLNILWRLVLGLMTALPIGLSVMYKTFTGGQSIIIIDPIAYIGNASYYGMFAPPGIQSFGERTGISLFSNVTLPFMVAASSANGSEPPLPVGAQAYGFNVLLLTNTTAAMLDIPQPDYITAVQRLLAAGESWEVTAHIAGTVAKFDYSKTTDLEAWNSTFMSTCEAAAGSPSAYKMQQFQVPHSLNLMNSPGANQSFQYLGFLPLPDPANALPGENDLPTCSNFSHYSQRYDIARRPCTGSWIITRGGIQLISGSCDETLLPQEKQVVIAKDGGMFLSYFYMPSLAELLGAFATTRNGSDWERPLTATGVAAMMWSRSIVMHGAANIGETHDTVIWRNGIMDNLTLSEAGLIYPVNDMVRYTRPALRRSGLLYCALGLQPLLILISLALMVSILNSTPIDKGFGLMSILSGIDRRSLDIVSGASLSGKLRKEVRLVIHPTRYKQGNEIRYHAIPSSSASPRNKRLTRNTTYY